jgi:hypothetical protein
MDVLMMVRSIPRSFFDASGKFRAEFSKSVGIAGTIKSVAVGTAHSALTAGLWGIAWNEPVPSSFFTTNLGTSTTHGIALEHKADCTIAHCRGGTSYYTYDFKTQDVVSNTATTELTNGYLVHTAPSGTRLANVVNNSGAPSDSEHNIELSTSIDWNTPVTRILTPPNIAAGSLNINRRAMPILVMRPDTQEIEIFLSLNYDGGGCRLIKAVIDANDPQAGAVTWVEMGKIPYVIGQIHAANRLIGYYDTETSTYWLPYTCTTGTDGLLTLSAGGFSGSGANQNAHFVPGVRLKASGGKFNNGTYNADALVNFYVARAYSDQQATGVALDVLKSSFGIHQGYFRDTTALYRNYRDYAVVFRAVLRRSLRRCVLYLSGGSTGGH